MYSCRPQSKFLADLYKFTFIISVCCGIEKNKMGKHNKISRREFEKRRHQAQKLKKMKSKQNVDREYVDLNDVKEQEINKHTVTVEIPTNRKFKYM